MRIHYPEPKVYVVSQKIRNSSVKEGKFLINKEDECFGNMLNRATIRIDKREGKLLIKVMKENNPSRRGELFELLNEMRKRKELRGKFDVVWEKGRVLLLEKSGKAYYWNKERGEIEEYMIKKRNISIVFKESGVEII